MATSNRCVLRWCLALVSATLLGTGEVRGQCEAGWLETTGVPGASGEVRDFVWWDPDGSGPLGERLAAIGDFSAISTAAASSLAIFDPSNEVWSALGSDVITGAILDIARARGGSLLIGGSIQINGMPATPRGQIARWNGSAWVTIPLAQPSGSPAIPEQVEELPNGDVVAVIRQSFARSVQQFDGTAWRVLGGTVTLSGGDASITALHVLANGDIVVGGKFDAIGDDAVRGVARWSENQWSALGGGLAADEASLLDELVLLPDGSLVAAGRFTSIGGVETGSFARWAGAQWSAMDESFRFAATDIAGAVSGEIVATGLVPVQPGQPWLSEVVRWDGTTWQLIGDGSASVRVGGGLSAVEVMPNGELLVGGFFSRAGSASAENMAVFGAGGWRAIGRGLDGDVTSISQLITGEVIVGGTFIMDGQSRGAVLQRVGDGWKELGSGVSGVQPVARPVLTVLANGDVVAANTLPALQSPGWFSVSRFDGEQWRTLGAAFNGLIEAVAVLSHGELVVGGRFTSVGNRLMSCVARWDGSEWQPIGQGVSGPVFSLHALPNGELLAGGQLRIGHEAVASGIARWDGQSWQGMGVPGPWPITSIARTPNGDIIVCGDSTSIGASLRAVSRFDGVAWQNLSVYARPGPASDVVVDSSSTIFVGGRLLSDLSNLTTARHAILMSEGNQFVPLDRSILEDRQDPRVNALHVLRDGTIAVGGQFSVAGDRAAGSIAFWGLPPHCRCDSLDFNNDGFSPSDEDLVDLLAVLAGGACSTPRCNDIDFNNDGLFPSDEDLLAFLRVLAGGACNG